MDSPIQPGQESTPEDLYTAAGTGDLEKVKRLIEVDGVDINGQTRGDTALVYAASRRLVRIVEYLLDSNAEVNASSVSGSAGGTALYAAARNGSYPCVLLLLQHNADVNICGREGSALQVAAWDGRTEIIQLLLEHGIDVNLPSPVSARYGGALHAAAHWAHQDAVRMILERGADVNKGFGEVTPLESAVKMLDEGKVVLLLEYGAGINDRILAMAARKRHEGVLRALLDACPESLAPGCDCEEALAAARGALGSIPPPAIEYEREGFTVAGVRSIWQRGLERYRIRRTSPPSHMYSERTYSSESQKRALRLEFCRALYKSAETQDGHFEALDRVASEFLSIQLWTLLQDNRSRDPTNVQAIDHLGYEQIVNTACKLLSQLPPTPVRLSRSEDILLSPEWFVTRPRSPAADSWDRLQVVVRMSSIVIEAALYITCSGRMHVEMLEFLGQSLNLLAAVESNNAGPTFSNASTWYLVKAFLWTTWQRIRLLWIGEKFQVQTRKGLDYEALGDNPPDFTFSSRILDLIQGPSSNNTIPYLCNWTYRLISTAGSPATTDLRRLLSRYEEFWGMHRARCNDAQPCSGEAPDTCMRFTGSIDAGQYAHDWKCLPQSCCRPIPWDRASYYMIESAASVSVDHGPLGDGYATYCEASTRTLVVSHVWAHGQGGRPEIGLNACLHRRYCAIAQDLGCNSYWIDTLCIPEDHSLRAKAISTINTVFMQGKACLVCDKDIMEIDVSGLQNGELSQRDQVHLRESILATVLFSDWNIRAWTFLEAIQGRKNILLLCKYNAVISLVETVEMVMSHGALDIGVAFIMVPHLLPRVRNIPSTPADDEDDWLNLDHEEDTIKLEHARFEETAALLRHRPASRNGDSFVIWQILAGMSTSQQPHEFWRSREGTQLTTGFLLTSAPRVTGFKGLSWAPCDPVVKKIPDLFEPHVERYPLSEMMTTNHGEITHRGFQAEWELFEFQLSPEPGPQRTTQDGSNVFLERLRDTVRLGFQIRDRRRLALLRPFLWYRDEKFGGDKISIRPSALQLVALCEFSTEEQGWRWLGVRFLDPAVFSPEFETEDILLV